LPDREQKELKNRFKNRSSNAKDSRSGQNAIKRWKLNHFMPLAPVSKKKKIFFSI
jgi:hypothetical protein